MDANGGVAGAVWSVLARMRIVCVVLAGLLTIVSVALLAKAIPLLLAWLALPVLAGAAIAFVQLRHRMLALCVVSAPLPGLLGVAAFAVWYGFVPFSVTTLMLGWILGAAIAQMFAGEIVLDLVDSVDAKDATRRAWRTVAPGGFAAVMACGAMLGAAWLGAGEGGPIPIAAAVAAGLSGLVVFPLAASGLTYDEDFVARANRLRERRERFFDPLLAVARPRWGFSAAGIALVFAVLGAFGLRDSAPFAEPALLWAAALVIVVVATAVTVRDWRAASATVLAMAVPAVLGLWIVARLELSDVSNVLLAMMAGLVSVLTLAGRSAWYFRGGDDATLGLARTLSRDSPTGAFTALLMTIAAVVSFPFAGNQVAAIAAVFAFSGVAALAFQPALTVAIETLFPRKATLEARYRVR